MTSSCPNRSKLKKYLWQIAFAKWSTSNVQTACNLILKNASRIDKENYAVLTTGIIVRYARPFGKKNNGVGCLPRKFGEFGNSKLQSTHDWILYSRNKFFAHSDALTDYEDLEGQQKKVLSLAITANFGDDGMASVQLQVIEPTLPLSIIPDIKALCSELLGKLEAEEHLLIRQLFTDSQLREGANLINIFDED